MLKIYTASRFTKAEIWFDILKQNDFKHTFISRWLRHYQLGTIETPERAYKFWQENLEDIKDADLVLYYAEPDDVQGGALVEIGAALAYEKKVLMVGSNVSHRSWQYHPLISRFCSINDALAYLKNH